MIFYCQLRIPSAGTGADIGCSWRTLFISFSSTCCKQTAQTLVHRILSTHIFLHLQFHQTLLSFRLHLSIQVVVIMSEQNFKFWLLVNVSVTIQSLQNFFVWVLLVFKSVWCQFCWNAYTWKTFLLQALVLSCYFSSQVPLTLSFSKRLISVNLSFFIVVGNKYNSFSQPSIRFKGIRLRMPPKSLNFSFLTFLKLF
jgi:hypothetical protein